MNASAVLLVVAGGTVGLSALAVPLGRLLGPKAGYPLAAALVTGTGGLLAITPRVLGGAPIDVTLQWAPSIGIALRLHLDPLGLLFALLVLGAGALVMAYSPRYLEGSVGGHARFYGLMALFAGSMLGLVLAGDVILLYVFWELTTLSSFFLIAHDAKGRPAAIRALVVTVLGGLALLAGVLLLSVASGTFHLTEILTGTVTEPVRTWALLLLLLAAFTKSAQLPFSFWLPGAMVAPTPVSAYLHSAAMVKAGIYLLARISPLFADTAVWRYGVLLTGLVTAVTAATIALHQDDMKRLLAYSTVSQLGFIVALIGVGTFGALVAALLHVVAHAAYKSTLFMVSGIVEHETGTRRMRELSGLWRNMPVTAAVSGLAVLSMAGLPPLLGYVSKEEAFSAVREVSGGAWLAPLATALIVLASVLTFAYSFRLLVDAFGGRDRATGQEAHPAFLAAPVVAGAAGLGLGFTASRLSGAFEGIAGSAITVSGPVDLGLWHGFTPAFWLSVVTVAAGLAVFAVRRRLVAALHTGWSPDGGAVFDRVQKAVRVAGERLVRPLLWTSPAWHLFLVMAVLSVAAVSTSLARGGREGLTMVDDPPEQWIAVVLILVASAGVAFARHRLAAVALLAVVGFLVSGFWVVRGAPDLALAQLLVETLTVAVVVLVFRHLPRDFPAVPLRRRVGSGLIALVVGGLAGTGTLLFTRRGELSDAARYYLRAAPQEAGSDNVVNAILADFRALDTLGETTVIAVAAVGVVALLRASGIGRR